MLETSINALESKCEEEYKYYKGLKPINTVGSFVDYYIIGSVSWIYNRCRYETIAKDYNDYLEKKIAPLHTYISSFKNSIHEAYEDYIQLIDCVNETKERIALDIETTIGQLNEQKRTEITKINSEQISSDSKDKKIKEVNDAINLEIEKAADFIDVTHIIVLKRLIDEHTTSMFDSLRIND